MIFLDEIDALGTSRADGESSDIRQVKNELLRQLDGFSSKSKRLSSEVHVTASAPLWQFCNCGIPSVSVQRFESTLLWNAVLPHARVQSRFFVQQTIPGRWTRLCYGGFSREFMSLCRVLESEPHLLLILFGMNHTHFNRKTLAGLLLERRGKLCWGWLAFEFVWDNCRLFRVLMLGGCVKLKQEQTFFFFCEQIFRK